MGNYINAVYDDWIDGVPQPNLQKKYGPNRFRTVTGLFYFYDLHAYLKDCKLEDVYANKEEKYYYFINGINEFEHNITNNDNVLPISDEVLKCFRENENFYIVLLHEHEFETENCFVLLNEILERDGLDISRFYMVNNNSKLSEYKAKYNSKLNVHSLDFLVKINAKNLSENPNALLTVKEGFAMMHNRTVKPHRYALLAKLKKSGLLDEIDWSLVMGWQRRKNLLQTKTDWTFYDSVLDKKEIEELKPILSWLEGINIKKSKYETVHTWFDIEENHNIDWNKTFEPKTYENSYINISTESCYFLKEIHISDKTIKPLFFYQIPIFVASYNHVKYVKERFGFDVFDDIIDHSYDNEPDNTKRMNMIFEEIKRVHENKDLIREFYRNNTIRLIKNRSIVMNLKHSTKDQDFFTNLIN